MPRNKKPRKKFTCRKIEIPRISEERIDVIIDTIRMSDSQLNLNCLMARLIEMI